MNVDRPASDLRVISLFTGVGGLDAGLHLAVGGRCRALAAVEGEAYAAAVLAARMASGSLAPFPVWSDARTFDARPFRGRVDGVVAGFPCQDVSLAGKRAGLEGERSGLWSEVVRVISECEPWFVLLENVAGLRMPRTISSAGPSCSSCGHAAALHGDDRCIHRDDDTFEPDCECAELVLAEEGTAPAEPVRVEAALGTVLGDLASQGFDAEWLSLRAADVGAPHRRERVFILAHRDYGRLAQLRAAHDDYGRDAPGHNAHGRGESVADAQGAGRDAGGGGGEGRRDPLEPAGCGGGAVGYASGARPSEHAGVGGDAGEERSAALGAGGKDVPDTSGVTVREQPERDQQHETECRHAEPGDEGGAWASPFPPGPDDADGWRHFLRQHPEAVPAFPNDGAFTGVLRDVDGHGAGAHVHLRWLALNRLLLRRLIHGVEVGGSEEGATVRTGDGVPELRSDGEPGATPPGLQQAAGGRGSMPLVPRVGRSAGRDQEGGATGGDPCVQDLRRVVPHAAAPRWQEAEPGVVRQGGVSDRAWPTDRSAAVGREEHCEDVRDLHETVRSVGREQAGCTDLQSQLRSETVAPRAPCSCVLTSRVDRLRSIGNAVVPLQAALAFLLLLDQALSDA